MMLNMIEPGVDRTAKTQLRLQKIARKWSPPRLDGGVRKGASVVGWATGLSLEGAGPYKVVGVDSLDEAMLVAARAMRRTGRPVGLLVWRGRHAWVMSGFQATGDPLLAGSRVTAAMSRTRCTRTVARARGAGALRPGRRCPSRKSAASSFGGARVLDLEHARPRRQVRPRASRTTSTSDPASRRRSDVGPPR